MSGGKLGHREWLDKAVPVLENWGVPDSESTRLADALWQIIREAGLEVPLSTATAELVQVEDTEPSVVGLRAMKVRGYPFPAEVVAEFDTMAGDRRLVAECLVLPGLLHIFAPGQLTLVENPRSAHG